jgi:hypothetical protein
LRFYRNLLGLKVTGESLNHGTEQEHLNNVAGARLRITGLKAANGPGIEFLEYLAPRTERPAPPDSRANDLALADNAQHRKLGKSGAQTRRAGNRIISPAVIEIPDKTPDFARGFLARDPDGHAIQVIEK